MLSVKETIALNNGILKVKVVAWSSRSAIGDFLENGLLKVKLQAPREKGKANAELIHLISTELWISKNAIEILSWDHSEIKTLKIVL